MAEAKQKKTLVEHAAYELTRAGMANNADPEARQCAVNTMALVRRIEKMNMNQRQASFVLEAFGLLTEFLPLTPISDDPDEWDKFEIDRKNVDTNEIEKKIVWQSRRCASIFSEDGGKTWVDQKTGKTGESITKEAADKQQSDIEQPRSSKKDSTEAAPAAPANVLSDAPAGEVGLVPETKSPENSDSSNSSKNSNSSKAK